MNRIFSLYFLLFLNLNYLKVKMPDPQTLVSIAPMAGSSEHNDQCNLSETISKSLNLMLTFPWNDLAKLDGCYCRHIEAILARVFP